MTTLYGIPNCDSVRKARGWLDSHGITYAFHDFRKHGLDSDLLRAWISAAGWEALLNRKGTTWRQLPAAQREGIDGKTAHDLMLAQPSLIKRPVLQAGTRVHIGFDPDHYQTLFKG